jgi:hypothetical protein
MKAILCFGTAVVAFTGLSDASPPAGPFSLFAYGQNITGLPIFFSTSQAYIGAPSSHSDSFNVSCEFASCI